MCNVYRIYQAEVSAVIELSLIPIGTGTINKTSEPRYNHIIRLCDEGNIVT